MTVWYRVRNLERSLDFYARTLGFTQTFVDRDARWARLQREDMEIAVWEAGDDEGGVASLTVEDVRGEAERLRSAGVDVGVVIELHGEVRLVDVFDPDGNRVQLTEDVRAEQAPSGR